MFLYLTAGTSDFMETLQKKYAEERMRVLYGGNQSVLMHRTNSKTKFSTPHSFIVADEKGDFTDAGFYTLTYVDIFDDSSISFEERMKARDFKFMKEKGFVAYALLKPIKATTFVLMIQWTGPDSYQVWKASAAYKHDFDFMEEHVASVRQPTTLGVSPYTKEYSTAPVEEEDDEQENF